MDQLSERRINYRELQGIAKKMQLPGNLKYNLLLEVIRARKEGKEHVVDKILGEQKLERVRRKHEKLGSQESAYQHLRMTLNKMPTHVMPHHDYHNTMMQHPNVSVTGISGSSPHIVMANSNMSNRHIPYYPMSNSQAWSGVTNIFNSDVRTVLQMPQDVYQNLHKKAREECHHRILEDHKKNPPMTYGDWLKMMDQQKKTSTPIDKNYIQGGTPTRDVNKGYYVETEEISPNEDRKSFQVRDILNKCSNHGNYEQHNLASNQYDWSQLQCDIPSLLPDGFIPQMQTYLPSLNPWRNMYETVPDSTYIQHQFAYNLQQDPSSTSTSANAASPQTSDTISATDEDLPKDNNDIANHVTLPFHQSYLATAQREVQYLSQLDYEEPSTSNVPDLSSSVEEEENQIITGLPSEKDLSSSDSSFIVIDPSVGEFNSHQ